jgi:amino acid permease
MALSFLMIALIALIAFFVHLLLSSLVKQQVFEVTAQHYDELAAKQQMAESLNVDCH